MARDMRNYKTLARFLDQFTSQIYNEVIAHFFNA